jgi:hypothetical protein
MPPPASLYNAILQGCTGSGRHVLGHGRQLLHRDLLDERWLSAASVDVARQRAGRRPDGTTAPGRPRRPRGGWTGQKRRGLPDLEQSLGRWGSNLLPSSPTHRRQPARA